MAVSLVNVGAFSQVTTASVTPALPASYTTGDLLIVMVAAGGDSPATTVSSVTSGWTQIGGAPFRDYGTGGQFLAVFYKIAASASETAPTITLSAETGTGGGIFAASMAFRGVHQTTPFSLLEPSQGLTTASSTTYTPPLVHNPYSAAGMIVSLVATTDDNALNLSSANGYTLSSISGANYDSTSGSDGAIGMAYKTYSATGEITLPTWNQSLVGADFWSYQTLLLHADTEAALVPLVRTVGQYGNDFDTVISTGATTTDGVTNNIALAIESSAHRLSDTVQSKGEVELVATSFDNTANITNTAVKQLHDATTYSARGGNLIYDAKNKRYIFFGGFDGTTRYNQVWSQDVSKPGQPWRKLNPTGTPPTAKNLAAACYVRGTATTGGADKAFMVIWGGNIGASDSNEMHYLDVSTVGSESWGSITQTSAPTARSYITGHMVATDEPADASQNYIYLFGGWATNRENQLVRATFDVDSPGSLTWTTLTANGAGGSPSARSGAILDWNPSAGVLMLFGGYNGTSYLSDLWIYDGSWTQKSPSGTAPAGRELGAGGYDVTGDRFWYTGGWVGANNNGKNDVGYISNPNGSPAYVEVKANDTDDQGYAGNSSVAFCVNPDLRFLVLKAMYTIDSTERYGYIIDMADTSTPVYGIAEGEYLTERDAMATIWNPDRNEWVIIGGFGNMYDKETILSGTHLTDVWAFDPSTTTWRYAVKGYKSIPPMEGITACYDTTLDRIIIFGGLTGVGETSNQVWELKADALGNYKARRLFSTGTPPTARWLCACAYDATANRMIITMGGNDTSASNQVWELSFASDDDGAWTQRTPSGTAPTAVIGPAFWNKTSNSRLYIGGGATNAALTTTTNQFCYLDYSTTNCAWTTGLTTLPYSVRTPAFAYDSTNDRAHFWGGYNGSTESQNWGYTTLASIAWSSVGSTTGKRSHAAIYSTVDSKMYIFGGRPSTGRWYRETQNYTVADGFDVLYPTIYNPDYLLVTGKSTGSYHWQAWATEAADSAKSSYGGNAESSADFVISAGATEVAVTKSLKYSVKKTYSTTKSLKYTVEDANAITKSLTYRVSTVASATKSLRYAIEDINAITKSLKYTVKKTVTATTKSLQYNVIVQTTSSVTKSLKYAVKQPESTTKSLRYVIKDVNAVTKSLKYTVETTPTEMTKNMMYQVSTVIPITKSLKYTVKQPESATKSLKYAVKQAEQITKSLTYAVFDTNAVTKSMSYSVRSKVNATKSLRYEVDTGYRYWVGGTGNWTDSSHWALTSGGDGGAPVPGWTDNARFDGNSFSANGQSVLIDADVDVGSFDMTGVTETVTVAFDYVNFWDNLWVYGDFILADSVIWEQVPAYSRIRLEGTGSHVFDSKGKNLGQTTIQFRGTGQYTLMSDLINQDSSMYGNIEIWHTTVDLNDFNLDVPALYVYDDGFLYGGAGTITIRSNCDIEETAFDPETSEMIFTGETTSANIGLSNFNLLTIQNTLGTSTAYLYVYSGTQAYINGATISVDPGVNLIVYDDVHADDFYISGTSTDIVTINSNTTVKRTFVKTSGDLTADYLDISYNIASGGNWIKGTGFVGDNNDIDGWKDLGLSTTKALAYHIENVEAITRSLKYAIKDTTNVQKSLAYRVSTVQQVNKSLAYYVFLQGGITKSLKYVVKTTPTETTKAMQYEIKPAINVTKSMTYKVRVPQPEITKSVTYTVKQPESATKSLRYAIRDTQSVSKSLKYVVKAPATEITKSLRYQVSVGLSVQKSLKYTVKDVANQQTKSMTYAVVTTPTDIQKNMAYYVRDTNSATKSLKYVVTAPVSVQKSLAYQIQNIEAVTRSMKYTVKQAELVQKSLVYRIRNVAEAILTKSMQYAVKADVTIQKSLKYVIRDTTAQQKSLVYMILTDTFAQKTLRYHVSVGTAVQKSMKYAVRGSTVEISKSLTYSVVTSDSATKGMSYSVKGSVEVQKSLKYVIVRNAPFIEKAMSYSVLPSGQIINSMKYVVKTTRPMIQNTLRYFIATTGLFTKSVKYTVKRGIVTTRQLTYRVKTDSLIQHTMTYSLQNLSSASKSLKYTVETTDSETKSLRYAVKSVTQITKSLQYVIFRTPVETKQLKYAVKPTVQVTRSMRYDIQSVNAQNKSLKYVVSSTEQLTSSLSYSVKVTRGANRQMTYVLLAGGNVEKLMKYTVDSTNVQTKSMTYELRARGRRLAMGRGGRIIARDGIIKAGESTSRTRR